MSHKAHTARPDYKLQSGLLSAAEDRFGGKNAVCVPDVPANVKTSDNLNSALFDEGKDVLLAIGLVKAAEFLHSPIADGDHARLRTLRCAMCPEDLIKLVFAMGMAVTSGLSAVNLLPAARKGENGCGAYW